MEKIKIIDSQIKDLKEQLLKVKGTPTEVYTRIVGYYRSIKNWNLGKKEEYQQRLTYKFPDKISLKSRLVNN
ncbi:MAG: hypothetical protein JW969_02275 [Spirochaetales bacterium]|nr:hypothetical protein [Spirochaetales bacterium]